MLHLFIGSDSTKVRASLNGAVEKRAKTSEIIRITDAHALYDLDAALMGGGLFGGPRTVVLDSTLTHDEMRARVLDQLPHLKSTSDEIYIVELALDAATKKQVEKYAESSTKFELAKSEKRETIFGLVRPLQDGKKKDLWVAYQRELVAGKASEAIHGMLFYAAKDALLRKPTDVRARRLIADLAALPHEARREGFELEYALERFVLSNV